MQPIDTKIQTVSDSLEYQTQRATEEGVPCLLKVTEGDFLKFFKKVIIS